MTMKYDLFVPHLARLSFVFWWCVREEEGGRLEPLTFQISTFDIQSQTAHTTFHKALARFIIQII